jgi:hypothetical protein
LYDTTYLKTNSGCHLYSQCCACESCIKSNKKKTKLGQNGPNIGPDGKIINKIPFNTPDSIPFIPIFSSSLHETALIHFTRESCLGDRIVCQFGTGLVVENNRTDGQIVVRIVNDAPQLNIDRGHKIYQKQQRQQQWLKEQQLLVQQQLQQQQREERTSDGQIGPNPANSILIKPDTDLIQSLLDGKTPSFGPKEQLTPKGEEEDGSLLYGFSLDQVDGGDNGKDNHNINARTTTDPVDSADPITIDSTADQIIPCDDQLGPDQNQLQATTPTLTPRKPQPPTTPGGTSLLSSPFRGVRLFPTHPTLIQDGNDHHPADDSSLVNITHTSSSTTVVATTPHNTSHHHTYSPPITNPLPEPLNLNSKSILDPKTHIKSTMLITLHPTQYDFILACKGDVVLTRYGRGVVKEYRIRAKQYVVVYSWGEAILQPEFVYMRDVVGADGTGCTVM